jgi:diguanylate cyclase (GGDEF)-like protein/PAS domain S-box-containing protein
MIKEQTYNHLKNYAKLFKNLPHAVLIISDNLIINCNDAAVKIFGCNSKEELIGANIRHLCSVNHYDCKNLYKEYDRIMKLALQKGSYIFEWQYVKKDGSKFYYEVSLTSISENGKNIISAVIRNITETKLRENKMIKNLVIKDVLTGLYNRAYIINTLKSEINNVCSNKRNLALMLIDIDKFKNINDNLGCTYGDRVIKIASKRIYGCIRNSGILARTGSNEFGVLFPNVKESYEVVKFAKIIIDKFERPIKINKREIYISISIGTASYPNHGKSFEKLVRNVNIAMYKAKEYCGNSFNVYTSSLNEKIKKEFIIENGLRYALERNEFSLHYQPIMNLKTNQIVGAEALIRWNHPIYGNIPPDEFIPIAEKKGFIEAIGEWVMRNACLDNKNLQKAGFSPIFVAINISVKQLEKSGFIDLVNRILMDTDLESKYLELEITESISMNNVRNRVAVLKKLRDLGVSLSIDDFGTGYSSLGRLKKLPFSKLKIDKCFVNDINIDICNNKIITTIIEIAKTLNLNIIAEGVETKEQLDFLRKEKCDMIQGYYYSRPIPSKTLEKLILKYNKK